MFDIVKSWNGSREVLSRQRSYHQTTPLSPEQARQYIAKSKSQDKELWVMLKARGSATPRQLLASRPGMLLSSVRRSCDTLFNNGLIRRVKFETNELGRPESVWTA